MYCSDLTDWDDRLFSVPEAGHARFARALADLLDTRLAGTQNLCFSPKIYTLSSLFLRPAGSGSELWPLETSGAYMKELVEHADTSMTTWTTAQVKKGLELLNRYFQGCARRLQE